MKKQKFVVFSHRIQNFGRVLPKKKELSQIVGGGSPRGKQNFFAFLDDLDHVKKKKLGKLGPNRKAPHPFRENSLIFFFEPFPY